MKLTIGTMLPLVDGPNNGERRPIDVVPRIRPDGALRVVQYLLIGPALYELDPTHLCWRYVTFGL